MVLKFRLISNEEDDFVRDFEILAEQTFFDFHMAIQDNLHFDKSQIASFFTCSQEWEKEQEITLFELSEEESARVITMENAVVGEQAMEIHDKLIYVFDVFNERLFFMELVEKKEKDPSKEYPLCSFEKGHAPQQLLMDQLFGERDFSDGSILDDTALGEDFPDLDSLDDLGYDPQNSDDDLPDGY
jgi:hypothetical protein